MSSRLALLALVLASRLVLADALTVLTVGKVAVLKHDRGVIRVGRDPRLAGAPSPLCPVPTTVELSSYADSTQRVIVASTVELDCAKWKRRGGGYVYSDPAAPGGVRAIRYGRKGLAITFGGAAYQVPAAPAGYVQAWFTVGETRFNIRAHNFKSNEPGLLATRPLSKTASTGERAFWQVLHHEWETGAEKAAFDHTAFDCLTKASAQDRKDGRSRFLLAMLHLYRFGQGVENFADVNGAALTEIELAHVAFQQALPLLWEGTKGDSRVAGFAAATTFGLGMARKDPALQAQGMAELDAAFQANPFFNVFDYIPVAQAVPSFDPRFNPVYTRMSTYLADPDTLGCVTSQPEICNNSGYAPHNIAGSLALFGDIIAKGGDLGGAQMWYGLGLVLADSGGTGPYRFLPELQTRAATAAERVALFRDGDPGNDPTVIGTGAEACAACHTR